MGFTVIICKINAVILHFEYEKESLRINSILITEHWLCVLLVQEQQETLLKQQKTNAEDVLDFSSLTLEEPSSPEEEVVTNTSSSKVSPQTRLEEIAV